MEIQGEWTIEEFREIVGEVVDELPEVFFKELSGGVVVDERAYLSDDAVADDRYTMGHYHVSGLGRQIKIYYGSFVLLFPHLDRERLKNRIRSVVRHEFRHHMEFISGIHGSTSLEAEDERELKRYLESRNK